MWKVVSAKVVYHPMCGSGADGVLYWDYDTSLARVTPDTHRFLPLGRTGTTKMARGLSKNKNLVSADSDYVWMPFKVDNASSRIAGRASVYLTVLSVDPK